jgi:hypothetical protein
MSGDPKRWIDDDASPGLARAMLRAGEELEMPPGVEARVRASLAASVPALAPGTLGTAKAGAPVVLGKAKAVGVFVALVGAGSVAMVIQSSPENGLRGGVAPSATSSVEARASSIERPMPPPSEGSSDSEADGLYRAPVATSTPAARASSNVVAVPKAAGGPRGEANASRTSKLALEARLLGEARTALERGDVVLAEAKLASLEPPVALAEERDALAVRCAAARGDVPRTLRLSEAFFRAYPASPLRPHVTQSVEQVKNE